MPRPLPVSEGDLDTLARTLYGEARGESLLGQQAVAWVIRNRVEKPNGWSKGVEGICTAHAQFSCWLVTDVNRPKLLSLSPETDEYKALFEVGRSVMAGEIDDPTLGATHYLVTGTPASWADGQTPLTEIGRHSFYNVA